MNLKEQFESIRLTRKQLEDMPPEAFKAFDEMIAKQEATYAAMKSHGALGVRKAFELLSEKLAERGFGIASQNVFVNLEWLMASGRRGVLWMGLGLREGDVLLAVESNGFGGMFHSMIGLKNLIGHALLVSSYEEDGIEFPLRTDLNFTLAYNSLWSLNQPVMVVRPSFAIERVFTKRALDNLAGQTVYFDQKFEMGERNRNGQISLYCTEYVHLVFKTGFSGRESGLSPYDFTTNQLAKIPAKLEENMSRAGVRLRDGYLAPDNLLTNQASWPTINCMSAMRACQFHPMSFAPGFALATSKQCVRCFERSSSETSDSRSVLLAETSLGSTCERRQSFRVLPSCDARSHAALRATK